VFFFISKHGNKYPTVIEPSSRIEHALLDNNQSIANTQDSRVSPNHTHIDDISISMIDALINVSSFVTSFSTLLIQHEDRKVFHTQAEIKFKENGLMLSIVRILFSDRKMLLTN
jgi:hypothetical protein